MNKTSSLPGRALVEAAITFMEDKKGEDIAIYHVAEPSSMTDWCIICSAGSTTHARAIAQGVDTGLKQQHTPPVFQEGVEDGRWAVIDYSDVVVHVMVTQMREYYDIEQLWSHGTRYTPEEFRGVDRAATPSVKSKPVRKRKAPVKKKIR